jgi:quercetin dioxygenase-like cupin family protein
LAGGGHGLTIPKLIMRRDRQQMNQWKRRIMQPEIPSKPKGLPGAEVAKAAELVNYQDGAIVSREIVKKPTGNVTIFAFDEGQGLSEHSAPFDALVHVLEGEVEIMIAGQRHQLRGGETILMPAGQPHALKALKRFKMMLTMIRS